MPPSVRRALVIEDEVAIRELLRLHLELAGFTLDESGDGRQALDMARATSFDLIPLDVMLPGLDGVSVCRAIRGGGANTETPIYPGWYQGRATHIHAEVTVNGRSIKVTQIAFPEATNNAVHTSGVYASRGTNPMSNLSDGIFSDSLASELVTPTGSPSGGYAATFQIGVSA